MTTSLDLLAAAAAFIAVASLKGIVLITLVLAVQLLAGKALPANWRYLLWFTVVVGLVTPLGFDAALLPRAAMPAMSGPSPLPGRTELVPPEDGIDMQAGDVYAAFSLPATAAQPAAPASAETLLRSWPALLSYLWLAGVLAVLGAIALSGLRFARLVQRAHAAPAALQELLRDCMRTTGCRREVTLRQSFEIAVPMIAGHVRPVLLLPVGLETQLARTQLRHVFIHELMHLQRGDIIGNWIVALVQALHWFNPLVWYGFFRMRQDRELACDAATLAQLAPAEHAAYGHTLLQLNDSPPGMPVPTLALGMLHARSHLHRRILMLAGAPRRSKWHGVMASLVFVPLAALAFSQPTVRPAVFEEQADVGPAAIGRRAAPRTVAAPVAAAAAPESATREAPVARAVPAPDADSALRSVPSQPATAAALPQATQLPTSTPVRELSDAPAAVILAPGTLVAAAPTQASPPPSPALSRFDTDVVAPAAASTLVAAAPVEAPASPAAATLAEALSEIERLAEAIDAAQDESLAFIEKWDGIANQCAAREGRFLGALSASCQRIRTAQRRGEVFGFAFACYQLNAWHEQLVETYRTTTPQGDVAPALQANARQLATFCSKTTYANEYPAFGAMIADAEALKYYPRRNVTAANVDLVRSEAYAALYRYDLSFNNANSMAIGASIGNVWGVQETTSMGTTYGVPAPDMGGGAGMGADGSGGGAAPASP